MDREVAVTSFSVEVGGMETNVGKISVLFVIVLPVRGEPVFAVIVGVEPFFSVIVNVSPSDVSVCSVTEAVFVVSDVSIFLDVNKTVDAVVVESPGHDVRSALGVEGEVIDVLEQDSVNSEPLVEPRVNINYKVCHT